MTFDQTSPIDERSVCASTKSWNPYGVFISGTWAWQTATTAAMEVRERNFMIMEECVRKTKNYETLRRGIAELPGGIL